MTSSFDEPDGIAPRGTVVVAGGRGEDAGTYERFGRRIAADGYRVRILPDVGTDLGASFAAAEKLLVDDGSPAPRVVVGSDTGALFALALAGRSVPGPDAVILAGLPISGGVDLLGFDAQVEARTACPNHQRVLRTSKSSLSAPIPTELIGASGDGAIPALGIHGTADTISPLEQAAARYPGTLVTIDGGRHDVLNDVTHRTVAATIVLFLERLRLGAGLPPIAQVRR